MWWLRETGDAVDVVIISPEPGMHKEIGQKLLALAEHPRDVQWVTYPETGFSVPWALFHKFDTADEEPAAEEEAPKRRRGRPRREETSTDNTSTSHEEE